MGRVVRPSEVATQVQTMTTALEANIERLYGVLAAIRSFVDENGLEGVAWSGMKDQMAAHETVIHGMIYAMEALIESGANLVSLCGNEYLSEDVLESQLETLQYNQRLYEDYIADYQRRLQDPLYYQIYSQTAYNMIQYYQQHLDNNNELITFANGKLDTIDQIDHAISNLNAGVESMLAQVKQGLQYLAGSWNGTGFSPAAGKNLSWMQKINQVKSEKLERIKERALISKLLDPYSSLLLDSEDRKRALKFLEDEMNARGGSIELGALDLKDWRDVAVFNAIVKLTGGHGLDPRDPNNLLRYLENLLVRSEIDGSEFEHIMHFDKDMFGAIKKDSDRTYKKVQNGGFHEWQEKSIKGVSMAADIVTAIAYDTLLSQFSSDAKQDAIEEVNDILEEELEESGRANTYGDDLQISEQKMYQQGSHFNKHGKAMGYESKKAYEEGARSFIENNKSNAEIYEGTWNSSRGMQSGEEQIIIRYEGKQVIINKETNQIIDYYEGTSLDGFIDMRKVQ